MNGKFEDRIGLDAPRHVFVTGGTGYLGAALIARLLERGHVVKALVRTGSEHKLPHGAQPVIGDALDARTFSAHVAPCDTFVQLVGVAHPAPWKERQFREIDLASVRASAEAAVAARVRHFVYVSVAQPAPVMRAYVRVRAECEARIRASGLSATIVRPWYVVGPGHRWPIVMKPAYWVLERLPTTRAAAIRLGLVSHEQMVTALVWSVENPATGTRILETEAIRDSSMRPRDRSATETP